MKPAKLHGVNTNQDYIKIKAMSDLLKKLKINPDNPRYIEGEKFERLKEKIRKFPEMLEKRPIIYDENNIILGGNRRYQVLEQLSREENFEVKDEYFLSAKNWTEEQKRFFIINDNLADGDWDYEKLANEWDMHKLSDWGVYLGKWQEDDGIDIDEHWQDMPDYGDPDEEKPYRSIMVHFETEEAVDDFIKIMGQKITDKTKYIWHPEKKKRDLKKMKYVSENES